MKNIVVITLVFLNSFLQCQPFTEIDAGLPNNAQIPAAAWGDYDNDGDLDILTINTGTKIYNNESGVFSEIITCPLMLNGFTSWGDYDNDGDLDMLLTGDYTEWDIGGPYYYYFYSEIWCNYGGGFGKISAGLPDIFCSTEDVGPSVGSVAWGDYDNDGDLDILLTGYTGSTRFSRVYRNDAGYFSDINAGLPGVVNSNVAWGDYDNDGDLDILLTGYTGSTRISRIYRNDSMVFKNTYANLQGISFGSATWGDYDNDGDLDILLTGYTGSDVISRVYRNDSGTFTNINASLTGISGSASWGDYDNDGDLDVLLAGGISKIYRNDNGVFTDINAGLSIYGSASWGDYDNDGDLDILLSGRTDSEQIISRIYRNDCPIPNVHPNPPSNLTSIANGTKVTLIWEKAVDEETPQEGLSYNIYIGTESLLGNTVSPMSDILNGYRKVVQTGNAQLNTSWTIKNLDPGTYYWSVAAIDHGSASSVFAPEKSFMILSSPMNVQIKHKDDFIKLTWDEVPGAARYYIYASNDPESNFVNVSKQGIFTNLSWTQTIGFEKKFYYVIAVSN